MNNLFTARAGYCTPGRPFEPAMPDEEFLRKALSAIKTRRGLIHGETKKGAMRCALGAFASKNDNACVNSAIASALQRYNDSMPHVTPEVRRKRVIAWIENRLKKLH